MFAAASCSSTISGRGVGYPKNSPVLCRTDLKRMHKFISNVERSNVKGMRRYLKKYGVINSELRFEEGVEKMTALQFAAKKGLGKVLSELLSSGCDVNKVTPFDAYTALHMACSCPDEEAALQMVTELVSHGANLSQSDYCGRTPLVIASERGYTRIVQVLCENHANVNQSFQKEEYPSGVQESLNCVLWPQKDEDEIADPFVGNCPLIQACREHHLQIVKTLIKCGANLGSVNHMENTALHIACMSYSRSAFNTVYTRFPLAGDRSIVQVLVESGSNMDHLNKYAEVPIDRCISGIRKISFWDYPEEDKIEETVTFLDIVQYLITSGCCVDWSHDSFHGKCQLKSALTCLLRSGEAVIEYDSQQLMHSFHKAVTLLLLAGCPVNDVDIQVLTALDGAFPSLLTMATRVQVAPCSLKRLCKYRIRQGVCKPLPCHLPGTQLPQCLQNYILLKVFD